MEYTDDYQFYRSYLIPGESVLWKGKPEKGNLFTKRELIMIPFGVFWLGFCLFWESIAIQSGQLIAIIWGLPFVAIGFYLLFGRFIQSAFLRDKTFYVVTNKKIIIKRGSRSKMYNAQDLPPMEVEIHKNGNGTILFCEETYTRRGRRHHTYIILENLKDVAYAQNAISQMEQ